MDAAGSTAPQVDPVEEIFSWRLDEFPRIARLRDAVLKAEPAVALHRSRLLVDYFEENGFDRERPLLRQANSLRYVLEHLEPVVFPEELIVGSVTEHRLGCVMFPEFQAASIWPELASLPHRARNPVQVSEEAVEEFGFRIFPYFLDKNINDYAKQTFGERDSLRLMERFVFYLVAHPNGVSHLIPDYGAVVHLGLDRTVDLARKKRDAVRGRGAEAARRRNLYEAIAIGCEGVTAFARNHARKCRRLAEAEKQPDRQDELRGIAEALDRVPARPAAGFHQALQSMWITHVAVLQENSDLAVNFGRMDQFLLPALQQDLESGKLDLRRAFELVLALYVKSNDHTPLIPTAAERLFSGAATDQSITLSGLDPAGNDGTNILSYLCLRAIDLLRLREPNVDARFHAGSPDAWYRRVLDVVRSTGATPALYNDDAIVPALVGKGASQEDARDYAVIGCVEMTVANKAYGMTGAILLNLAAVLEHTLHDGVHPLTGLPVGPETGRLEDFTAFDELWEAFETQLRFLVDKSVEAETLYDRAHRDLHPVPLLSALVQGPLDTGRDLTEGGAVYNSSGVWVLGLADVVDSLAALKTLVFEEKRITPAEMTSALRADFHGFDKVLAMCLRRAPKYGNDDPRADSLAVRVAEAVDQAYGVHTNFRGGPYHVGYWTMTLHTGYGDLISSLPSGRVKGQPLASGATPVSGAALRGPTASLSSTAVLPAGCLANGIANNHKIAASLLDEPGKMRILEQLVRGYFRKGGMQLQFVIADREMLVSALNDPAFARELLVRVSGYTTYFGDLDRAMQQEIIDRTEDVI